MNVNKKFYGEHLSHMETVKSKAVNMANLMSIFSGIKSAAHIVSRIKTPESMAKKIQNDNLPVNHHSALAVESDAIGVRISLNLYLMCMRFMKTLNASNQLTMRQAAGFCT